jgi:hypothetical protein
MALLSPADQQRLRDAFAEMTSPVRLVFFTQTLGCETCPQTRQILDELPPLSDKITIEEANLVLDAEKARQFGIDRVPAIALVAPNGDGLPDRGAGAPGVFDRGAGAPGVFDRGAGAPGVFKDSRIRFLGTPAGYEFMSLVQAVLLVGGRPPSLTEENRRKVEAIDRPVTMQVFTTPT